MKEQVNPRICPAKPPFPPAVAAVIDRVVPEGTAPFALFTTLARDPRLFDRFVARGFLGRGNLSLRERELVIARVTAQCGSEYEWGIHSHFFAEASGFTVQQVHSLIDGDASDPCWTSEADRTLIDLCDTLHATCDVGEALWDRLTVQFREEAILELLILAGNYRAVAYLTNALRLPLEPWAWTFDQARDRAGRAA